MAGEDMSNNPTLEDFIDAWRNDVSGEELARIGCAVLLKAKVKDGTEASVALERSRAILQIDGLSANGESGRDHMVDSTDSLSLMAERFVLREILQKLGGTD